MTIANAPFTDLARGAVVTSGPILLATDGSIQSDAAVRVAQLLSQRHGVAVRVVGVVQAIPVPSPDMGLVPPPAELDDVRKSEMLEQLRSQLAGKAGTDVNWPIEIVHGHPARAIVRTAHEHHASLIVLGLGRHRMLDRLVGTETAVQVLRLSTIPVLAVPPGCETLPLRGAAAVDFSELSIESARNALQLIEPGGTLHLVHVNTGVDDLIDEHLDTDRFDSAWEAVEGALEAPAGVRVRPLTLSGTPGRELLAFAHASHVELIALGTHGRGVLQRLVLGSVATQVLRGAECAVLITPVHRTGTPPHPIAARAPVADETVFAERLERFTRRNTGRRCSLEVDDPELGAQGQSYDYPFIGAAYDHHDARVEIWLGEAQAGGLRLTRSIGGVTAIDVLADPDGWDQVLRIAHGGGQTLLTFAR